MNVECVFILFSIMLADDFYKLIESESIVAIVLYNFLQTHGLLPDDTNPPMLHRHLVEARYLSINEKYELLTTFLNDIKNVYCE